MRRTQLWLNVLILALGGVLLTPHASADVQEELEQLRESFRKRYAKLVELKQAGKVGETWQGLVEAVAAENRNEKIDEETTVGQLIDGENKDRKRLYEIIAEAQQTTPEKVAERNALRNFSKAEAGEYLKGKDGKWRRKAAEE